MLGLTRMRRHARHMPNKLSVRLAAVVDALPLQKGMRVLEIGCGPGAAAREIALRIAPGYVLGIDRSRTAIAQARAACSDLLRSKAMGLRCVAIEDFALARDEPPYDLALAVRVGVLDGRHPDRQERALESIRNALTSRGTLWLGDGPSIHRLPLF